MVDALIVQEILDDDNFKKLTHDKTTSEEFSRLLSEHVEGYSQKKRLSDGMKELIKKLEEAENRMIVARNVGKFKEPDPEDKRLTDMCSAFELKEKSTQLTTQLENMINEGSIAHHEKAAVLENLRTRLTKAKEAGKAKLEEKLDKMATAVVRAEASFSLPVRSVKEFHRLDKELQSITQLEKLNAKNLTLAVRERIENKAVVQGDFDALMQTSCMWFESPLEFKARLSEAITAYAAGEQDRIKKEENEAFEKRLQEEQDILDKKHAEVARKKQEAENQLEEKLKEKRLEAAGKPVKEVPKKQPKPVKTVARVDLQSMFKDDRDAEYEEVNVAQLQAELEAEAKQREFAQAYAELKMASAEAEEAKKSRAVLDSKAAKLEREAKLAKIESLKKEAKTVSKPAVPAAPVKPLKSAEEKAAEQEEKLKAIDEKLAAKRLEAAAQPKKDVKEPPKKEKKVATKMSLLDFYSDEKDSILEKLASQEAAERVEREAAAQEAARLAAEEEAAAEAAWTAEEAAAWAEQNPGAPTTTIAPVAARAPTVVPDAKVAPKPVAPKPKRKPPVELENKWGAPVIPAGAVIEEDGDEDAVGPSLMESMPSLADALTAPVKKGPPPQPKKKEKKKWGKVDASLMGFIDENQFA